MRLRLILSRYHILSTGLIMRWLYPLLRGQHGVFYISAIPKVTWYKPLYKTFLEWFPKKYF